MVKGVMGIRGVACNRDYQENSHAYYYMQVYVHRDGKMFLCRGTLVLSI